MTVVKLTVPSPWARVWVWRLDKLSDDHALDFEILVMQCAVLLAATVLLAVSYTTGVVLAPDTRMNMLITTLASFPVWAASSLLLFWPTRVPSEPGEQGTRVTFVHRPSASAATGIITILLSLYVRVTLNNNFPSVEHYGISCVGDSLDAMQFLVWLLMAFFQLSAGASAMIRGPVYNLFFLFCLCIGSIARRLPHISIDANIPRSLTVKPKAD